MGDAGGTEELGVIASGQAAVAKIKLDFKKKKNLYEECDNETNECWTLESPGNLLISS